MKPFNLKEYIKNPNKKVITRNGRPVKIVYTDKKGMYPVVALIEYNNTYENVFAFTTDIVAHSGLPPSKVFIACSVNI